MQIAPQKFYKKDYWLHENLIYQHVYFRTEKIAFIINKQSAGKTVDVLDIGCGPATLSNLLRENVNYYGIDIAIHNQADNFREIDIATNRIQFSDRTFDYIVAAGLFEYLGTVEQQKLSEIKELLNPAGSLIITFTNMNHLRKPYYPTWNNTKSIDEFERMLRDCFFIEKSFPAYYSLSDADLTNPTLRRIQLHINIDLPVLGRLMGVHYIFICKKERP